METDPDDTYVRFPPLVNAVLARTEPDIARLAGDAPIGELDSAAVFAAELDYKPELKLLLEARPGDVDLQALFDTAVEQNALRVVRYLLTTGSVDVNRRGETGATPLLDAAELGHTEVVRILLEAGADWRVRDNSGDSPLSVAFEFGYEEMKRLLLARDKSGESAALQYLPLDSTELTRANPNHLRGVAAIAWTHRFDSIINARRIKYDGILSGGLTHVLFSEPPKYTAVLAMFLPRTWLRDQRLPLVPTVVRVADADAERPCELKVSDARLERAILERVLVPVFNGDEDVLPLFDRAIGALETTLRAVCIRLSPRMLWRAINTDESGAAIVRRMRRAWSGCTSERAMATSFCGSRQQCVLMRIEVLQDAVGVYLPVVIPSPWACFEEQETLLAPGNNVVLIKETRELGEYRTVHVRVSRGGVPLFYNGEYN